MNRLADTERTVAPMTPEDVINFWFNPAPTSFEGLAAFAMRLGPGLDDEIRERFEPVVELALRGGLSDWEQSRDSSLALILLLDQFPRHIYRGTARQYAGDERALRVCLAGLEAGWGAQLAPLQRNFFVMPLAHCETVSLHERNVGIQEQITADVPEFYGPFANVGASQAKKYRDVIQTFDRFPHRNEILGRANTTQEQAWLAAGGAARMPPDLARLARGSVRNCKEQR